MKRMKKMMSRRKNRNSTSALLRYYFLGYIMVLFIPLAISSGYYSNMIKTISEDDVQQKENDLNHSMALIDTMLNELGYLGDSMTLNAAVNQFKRVNNPFEYPNAYQVNKLQKQLPELYQINSAIFDYFIFFNYSDMVINNSVAYEYSDFYNLYMRPFESTSYEEWYDSMKGISQKSGLQPAKSYLYMRESKSSLKHIETKKDFLIYNRPLLLAGGAFENIGLIRFYIECSYIDTLMPAISDEAGRAFLITNNKKEPMYFKISNEMISSEELLQIVNVQDSFVKVGRDRYLLVHLESGDSGLHYYK